LKGYVRTPLKIVDHMVEKLFEERPPEATDIVLDSGCGPGDFIESIIRWCKKNGRLLPIIKGVELDPRHIPLAREKFSHYPNIEIEQRDFLMPSTEQYDFIICNPPYVPITEITEEEKRLYKPLFETATGRFDLYLLFFEKALKSLKKNGRLVFITPEKYTYVKTAKTLRRILSDIRIKEIEFLKEETFEGLTTYPIITVAENNKPAQETKIILRDGQIKYVPLPRDGESWIPFFHGKTKVRKRYTLKDICIRISCGVATGADQVFVKHTNKLDSGLQPFAYPTISGKELIPRADHLISSYSMLVPYSSNGRLKPLDELEFFAKYLSLPHIRKRLEKRTCVTRKPWYAFHENPPMGDILRPKILCKDIAAEPYFWVDKEGSIIPRHSVYYIVPKETTKLVEIAEYLRGDFARDWLIKHCQRAANGYIRLQSSVLKELPIPEELYY
jgi:adenine-specific DNA-methyltransferase